MLGVFTSWKSTNQGYWFFRPLFVKHLPLILVLIKIPPHLPVQRVFGQVTFLIVAVIQQVFTERLLNARHNSILGSEELEVYKKSFHPLGTHILIG